MHSRVCKNFIPGTSVSFVKNLSFTESLNFTAEFWQPFIDMDPLPNESVLLCGPFLGIVIEISRMLGVNLTYLEDKTENFMSFHMIKDGSIDIVLKPFPPMSLSMNNFSQYVQFSRVIGDIAMISILSSKKPISSLFRLVHIFNAEVWIAISISYLLVSIISFYLCNDFNVFMDYIAIALRQTIKRFDRKQRTSLITLIWFYASFILSSAFSGVLLTFLVFPTPFYKIDSVDDLAKTDIKFTVFKGENAIEYFNDPKESYYHVFMNRCVVEDPANDKKGEWENEVFDKISDGTYAIVSDEQYLDFYYATKSLNYSNLYRSKSNQLVLPYFMPLSQRNSQENVDLINKIICYLTESGIYEFRLKETLQINNDAIKLGYNEKFDKEYEYVPLLVDRFESLICLSVFSFIASLVSCLIEIIYFRCKRKSRLFIKGFKVKVY